MLVFTNLAGQLYITLKEYVLNHFEIQYAKFDNGFNVSHFCGTNMSYQTLFAL
jgi:hypothetical protein